MPPEIFQNLMTSAYREICDTRKVLAIGRFYNAVEGNACGTELFGPKFWHVVIQEQHHIITLKVILENAVLVDYDINT